MQINGQEPIGQLIKDYPVLKEVLQAYGLHCAGCFLNEWDTLAGGARLHGMSEREMYNLLRDVNEVIRTRVLYAETQ
ncbi:DUF1858 domain-containing protein [Candidatus Berkelbacteria bacterium]|nr:DUF1858 domain-containing protein [Candidatus Berkelbacteria bacterium]